MLVTVLLNFALGEIRAVVGYDAMRHPEPSDYSPQKIGGSGTVKLFDRFSFNPFCELIYGHKQVCVAARCRLKGSNHVQAPDCEGPGDGY